LLLALTLALVTKADHHEKSDSSDNTAGGKSAQKPWNYLFVDYMDVVDGKEEDYVKAEGLWLKVHESWAQEGRILAWGLAKARKKHVRNRICHMENCTLARRCRRPLRYGSN